MSVVTYEGSDCTAVLDTSAATLTLTHRGFATAKHKKMSSPWVIPLGAIRDIEIKEPRALTIGWVRFVLADRVGWDKDRYQDVNAFGLSAGKNIQPFIDDVNSARRFVKPTAVSTPPVQSRTQQTQAKSEEDRVRREADRVRKEAERVEANQRKEAWKEEKATASDRALRPDVAAMKAAMDTKSGVDVEIAYLTTHLGIDEKVDVACTGLYELHTGLLTVTDSRVLFTFHSRTKLVVEAADFSSITSINWSPGMVLGKITIVSQEKVLEVKSVVKGDGIAVVDRIREKLDAIVVAKAAAPRQTLAAPAAVAPAHAVASASAVASAPEPRVSEPASIEIIPPPPSVPPGWYPESADAGLVRYWNGAQWTDHTAPRPVP